MNPRDTQVGPARAAVARGRPPSALTMALRVAAEGG
jgi:hypothetical protein